MLRLACCVAALSALVKFLPLPRVLALLSVRRGGGPRLPARLTQERLAQLLDGLLGLNVLCFTPTCWKRATVLHRYLALGGRETRIVFGLRKAGGDLLSGHAWLESDDGPLLETSPPDYTVTYSFPS